MASPKIVACPSCGTKNRVPAAAGGVPRCGNCHNSLPWIVDAGDADFAEIVDAASIPVLLDPVGDMVRPVPHGEPGAGAARHRAGR